MTITVRWTRFGFSAGDQALLDIDALTVRGPGLTLLAGATGSGKSSLLRSATGLPAGLLGFAGRGSVERSPRGSPIGYVAQDCLDSFISFDAEHEFLLRRLAQGASHGRALLEAREALQGLRLAEGATRPFHALSAGERKRVALVTAESQDPAILLIDDPLNDLDHEWRTRFVGEIASAAQTRLVLCATHEVRPFLDVAREIVVLRGGRVLRQASPTRILAEADAFPELRLGPPPVRDRCPTTGGATVVEVDHVTCAHDGRRVLQDATASFPTGLHALRGANGSGKTTLLRALAGLRPPDRGHIRLLGQEMAPDEAGAFPLVTLLLENPSVAFFCRTTGDEVAFAPKNAGQSPSDVKAAVHAALAAFQLVPKSGQSPLTLSGGEKERLALACVAAANARIVLLDEPTHGLDARGRATLYSFLDELARNACVIVATHDDELASRAQTVQRIVEGRLVPETEVTTSTPS